MPETETATEDVKPQGGAEPESSPAPETPTPADPQEEKLDRIIAQRLGKYAERTKAAEESAAQYRERLARLEGQLAERQTQPPPQQPRFFTHEQLQVEVDAGRVTPAAMSAQLAWQAKEAGKQEIRQELQQRTIADRANQEIREYLTKIPALGTDTSPEFHKVRTAAYEIADEMGFPVTDPRVQRRALRETFGTPDKLAKIAEAREYDRQHADRYTEVGGGGARPAPSKDDPLKQVGETWLNYWQSRLSPEDLKRLAAREVQLKAQRRIQR